MILFAEKINDPGASFKVLSAALLVCLLACGAAAQQPAKKKPGERYPPGSYNALLGETRVHYKSYGKGDRALVFVHGWTCDQTVWRLQVPEFAAATRVIAVDLPGHGHSDKPQTDYTMDYFADAVAAVLRDAGVDKAVLVGHSMGTPVVRQFYRRHPGKTLGLVFVDGGLRPFGKKEDMEKFLAPLRGPQYQKTAAMMVGGMLATMKDARVREDVTRVMLSTPQHVAVSAMDGMSDERVFAPDKIGVPVLAVLARSPFWQPDTEQFFRSLAPRLEFRMWEGVGHFLMMERPADFNRELMSFLAQHKLLKLKVISDK